MNGIDETIERVESLYRSLTGREPPANGSLGIPPEKDPSQHVTEQVERLLGALAPTPQSVGFTFNPTLSLWESETETRICVEMPGVSREGVRLTVTNRVMTISATPNPPEEGFTLRLCERPSGEYRRTVTLPNGVAEDDISAQMRDGVLEIRFPKRIVEAATTRPIPIA